MGSYTNKYTDKHTEIHNYIIPSWIDGRIKKKKEEQKRKLEAQTRKHK
jgi:hypothetical protein